MPPHEVVFPLDSSTSLVGATLLDPLVLEPDMPAEVVARAEFPTTRPLALDPAIVAGVLEDAFLLEVVP